MIEEWGAIVGLVTGIVGLWWRLELIRKRSIDIAVWRQSINYRLDMIDKDLKRGDIRFDEHSKTDKEILHCLQDMVRRLDRLELLLEEMEKRMK